MSMGGHLASVHKAQEYHDIQMMIAKASRAFGTTWLGGSDCQTVIICHYNHSNMIYLFVCFDTVFFQCCCVFQEGIWLWSDGTRFDFRPCGKFDNRWWKQHCLQMNYGGKSH